MDGLDTIWILAVPLLVLLNGLFVAAEFALVTIRPTEVEELIRQGRTGAVAARSAVRSLDNAIAATQLGITLASLLLGWIGEETVGRLIAPALTLALGAHHAVLTHSISATLALVVITGMHVVLGELAPKSIALQRPRAVALLVARPLLIFERVFSPAIALLNGLGNLVVRGIGLRPQPSHSRAHTVAELTMLVDETQSAGFLKDSQADVLRNVFRLTKKTVGEVMLPLDRADLLDLRWTPEKTLDVVTDQAHTRMPVFDKVRTNIVGIVNAKDLFHVTRLKGVANVLDVMRPPVFVRGDVRVDDQLREFQKKRLHMAIVKDREGGVVGIVTLEDILEEIVGEIEDEFDRPRTGAPWD